MAICRINNEFKFKIMSVFNSKKQFASVRKTAATSHISIDLPKLIKLGIQVGKSEALTPDDILRRAQNIVNKRAPDLTGTRYTMAVGETLRNPDFLKTVKERL